jgi:hypothetical protein
MKARIRVCFPSGCGDVEPERPALCFGERCRSLSYIIRPSRTWPDCAAGPRRSPGPAPCDKPKAAMAGSGATKVGTSGRTSVAQDPGDASDSPLRSVMRTVRPSRAITSCIFDTVFSNIMSPGAITITGRSLSIGAIALCLSSGSKTFGVNVGDFLQLERALQRKRIVRRTTDE